MALVFIRISVFGGMTCVCPLMLIDEGSSGVVLGRKGRMVKRRRVSFIMAVMIESLKRG